MPEQMTAAQYRATQAPKGKGHTSGHESADSSTGRKKSTKTAGSDAPTASQLKARAAIAKVGRYKGEFDGQPARRYVVRDEDEARRLDEAFYSITNTQP